MDAIEKCLDLVDEPTMSELAPSLESAIKQSVGMPSKVSITTNCRHAIELVALMHTLESH